jgi:hypothetical protein
MVKDSYPLPRIDEMLECMHGAKVFSKFDLKMGYNQLCIKPEDVWKTAFMTPNGPYVMLVMTFRFANAPAYFQRWMFETLGSILHWRVENYIDNTGSHHLTMEEHVQVNLGHPAEVPRVGTIRKRQEMRISSRHPPVPRCRGFAKGLRDGKDEGGHD